MASTIRCKGTLRIAKWSGATLGDFLPAVNSTKMEITATESEKKTVVSRQRETDGQALASSAKAQPHTIAIDVNTFTAEILAMIFAGSVRAPTGTGGSVTDESVTLNGYDSAKLAKGGADDGLISNVVVTTDPAGTTYTEGTDYTYNPRLGLIERVAGSTIGDGDSVLVDYDYAAADADGEVVLGGTKAQQKVKILFDGVDLDTEEDLIGEIDVAALISNTSIDPLSDDYGTGTLTGTLETLDGASEPYRFRGVFG